MTEPRRPLRAMLTGAFAGLSACAGGDTGAVPRESAMGRDYLSASARVWRDDLVRVRVEMRGDAGEAGLTDYARCVAAGFALDQDMGFVRHVRTVTDKEGGVWHADAVYSVTSALPAGQSTIDAEVTVADCADRKIPTMPKTGA